MATVFRLRWAGTDKIPQQAATFLTETKIAHLGISELGQISDQGEELEENTGCQLPYLFLFLSQPGLFLGRDLTKDCLDVSQPSVTKPRPSIENTTTG